MSKLDWKPTSDVFARYAKVAHSGRYTVWVYPPECVECADIVPHWTGDSGGLNQDRGPCTSLADGIEMAEAWLAERTRREVFSATGKVIGHSVPAMRERESDDAYRARLLSQFRKESYGCDPFPGSTLATATGKDLDRFGNTVYSMPRLGSDLPTNAPVEPKCTCGAENKRAGTHSMMCAVSINMYEREGCSVSTSGESVSVVGKGVDKTVVRAPRFNINVCDCGAVDGNGIPHSSRCAVYDPNIRLAPKPNANGDVLDANWTVYGEMVTRSNRDITRTIMGVDPAVPAKPSLRERLARELRLDPIASDDVVFATAAKRLAGQYTAFDLAVAVNKELTSRADAAQRKVESLLDELYNEARENDSLRAIVADQELRLRKRK